MTTKQQAYDHPAYEVPIVISAGETGAASGTSYGKFVAFSAMMLKSVTYTPTVGGTAGGTDAANSNLQLVKISGTSTTTVATTTFGSGNALGTYTGTNVSFTVTTLAQGDIVQVKNGTDTALKAVVTYELYVVPGANLTA